MNQLSAMLMTETRHTLKQYADSSNKIYDFDIFGLYIEHYPVGVFGTRLEVPTIVLDRRLGQAADSRFQIRLSFSSVSAWYNFHIPQIPLGVEAVRESYAKFTEVWTNALDGFASVTPMSCRIHHGMDHCGNRMCRNASRIVYHYQDTSIDRMVDDAIRYADAIDAISKSYRMTY